MRHKNKEYFCQRIMLFKCSDNRGFTIIEIVITIAVVAILSAILVPVISQNIQSARFARAASDVKTLGEAIVQFRKDTAVWPTSRAGAPIYMLFSDVDSTNDGIPDTSFLPSGWTIDRNFRLSMAYHLINNTDNITRGPSAAGTPSWNGPYLSIVRPDPWGTAYVVNAQLLGGTANVYVLSAGPGRPAQVETPFDGSGPPPADSDDIAFRLQ
jgi:prepilin-type N-terminal cleavage/methylation domain-containing protein